MMSAQLKLISSLAVLASSVAIVSPLELGASATLPMHLALPNQGAAQVAQTQVSQSPRQSPLQQIAAQVRGWESTEVESSDADVSSSDENEADQEGPQPHRLDSSFRQFMFNKYGSFFFAKNEG
jgi:hypothetical protein